MIKMSLKGMNEKWKKKNVLLGSSVTMTDCIMELNEQLTFFFSPKNIITSFLNLILRILVFKKPQATPCFVEKEYMGYEHTNGWGSFCSMELHRKEMLFQYQKMVLDHCPNYFQINYTFAFQRLLIFLETWPYDSSWYQRNKSYNCSPGWPGQIIIWMTRTCHLDAALKC